MVLLNIEKTKPKFRSLNCLQTKKTVAPTDTSKIYIKMHADYNHVMDATMEISSMSDGTLE